MKKLFFLDDRFSIIFFEPLKMVDPILCIIIIERTNGLVSFPGVSKRIKTLNHIGSIPNVNHECT